jgi:hypothetical protein
VQMAVFSYSIRPRTYPAGVVNWPSAFAGDSALTAAMLDRVLPHSTIVDKRKAGLLIAPTKGCKQ